MGRDEDALRAFRSAEALVDDVLRLPLLQLVPEDLQKSGTMEKVPSSCGGGDVHHMCTCVLSTFTT